jgi:Flp pilus assembly protein TadG
LQIRPVGRTRRRRTGTRGQSLAEFALVIPIFLLLLLGLMDFGFLLYSRMTVINAARDGARVGITLTDTPNVITAQVASQVTGSGGGMITNGMVTTTCIVGTGAGQHCSPNFANAVPGDSVKVTVTYPYHPFFPFLFGQTINMSSTVQMTLE